VPLYEMQCDKCGTWELYRPKPESVREAPCPKCGGPSRRKFITKFGLPPFKSYWCESLSQDPYKPVYIDSREKERKLLKKFGFERVK